MIDHLVGWVVSALLAINGILFLILLGQIRRVEATISKIFDDLASFVQSKTCADHRRMCFNTCPIRLRPGGQTIGEEIT
jgi:hypothetical protein